MNVIADYKNGNFRTVLYDDGTKIRETEDDEFLPEYPDCMDITISKKCNNGCEYCYMKCAPDGDHADIEAYYTLLRDMPSGMEVAINLNSEPNPQLIEFLALMYAQGVFVNVTLHERDFMRCVPLLKDLTRRELVRGIGVSYTGETDTDEFIAAVKEFPNAVIHTIAGLITEDTINNLGGHGLKLLILGYKIVGRGRGFYWKYSDDVKDGIKWLSGQIMNIADKFAVISFDGLAIKQLELKKLFATEYSKFYQGDEGEFTFYLDLVDGYYAVNSLSCEHFDIEPGQTIKDMFQHVRKVTGKPVFEGE